MNTEHHMARMSKPTSVETLKSAAEAIRAEWGEDYGSAWNRVRAFHLAVADLLDLDADCETPADYDESKDAGRQFALVVARAYLGEA